MGAVLVAAAGFLLALLATTLFVGMARDTGARLFSPLPAVPADVLLCALAVAGALLTVWLGLGVVAAALSAVPGAVGRAARGVADRVAPVAVRRGVAFLLGTALVASFAPSTAIGSPLGPDHPGSGVTAGVTVDSTLPGVPLPDLRPPSGGEVPDPSLRPPDADSSAAPSSTSNTNSPIAPTGSTGLGPLGPSSPRAAFAPADRPGTAPGAARSMAESVTVRRGDTLWDVAARHLGSAASTAEIATEWPRWYALNADLIGDDPDLILPGQRLVAPSPAHHTAPTIPTNPTDGAS